MDLPMRSIMAARRIPISYGPLCDILPSETFPTFSVFAWVAFYHALAQEQGKTNWLSVASLQSDFQIECQHSQYLSSGQIDSKEHYWIL
jgi:hypothetical protein